jgi:hypothetical protein
MPWTYDDPPSVAINWTQSEIEACVDAANAVLADGGSDEDAIFACINAAGKSEVNMNRGMERRFVPAELRIFEDDDGVRHIRGYGAVYNELSEDLGGFRERIDPGAFTKTLQEADVRSLWNHDPNYVLGRSESQTLTVREDDRGLFYDVVPPDTQWARDLMISIERGDVDAASFGFRTIRDDWTQDEEGDVIRSLREVELYDLGPVTFPAYPQTSAEARDHAAALQQDTDAPPEAGHPSDDDGTDTRASTDLLRRRLDLAELDV